MARFEREGFSLNYEVHGSGPPLLLIHGLGSSACDWEAQLQLVSRVREGQRSALLHHIAHLPEVPGPWVFVGVVGPLEGNSADIGGHDQAIVW